MKTTENTNTLRTLMMIFWAIMVALKDDFDGDTMNAIMKAVGSATGLSMGMGPLAPGSGNQEPQASASDYVFGIRGLADYLGVSDPTAQKYVNSGKLDPAIRRVGKKYSFLKSKVDEIFANK